MTAITSLPAWLLVGAAFVFTFVAAALGRLVARTLVPDGERDHVQSIASPLMPALGATFAVLIAITAAGEAGYLKSAQDLVAGEAAAASRLAWASTSPGVDSEPIQTALTEYLVATRVNEWAGQVGERDDRATRDAISMLERTVRVEAARSELGTPASTELLTSLDAVTSSRRARLAAASRQLPTLYVLTLVASGAALVANAGVLTFRSSLRTALLTSGLVVVVALGLALLLAVSEPWRGPLTVSGAPIDDVVADLHDAFFAP